MLSHNIKYHIQNDAYEMFVKEFVKQRNLTKNTLKWLMIYDSFQKQHYLSNYFPMLKSN